MLGAKDLDAKNLGPKNLGAKILGTKNLGAKILGANILGAPTQHYDSISKVCLIRDFSTYPPIYYAFKNWIWHDCVLDFICCLIRVRWSYIPAF